MKKAMIFAAAAAMLLVACEKPDTPEVQDPNTVVFGGETYKTVTLANGQTWMAENLRFVPEGMAVSADGTKGDIWYPAEDGTGKGLTDEASIKKLGYLYSAFAALNIDREKVGLNAKLDEYKTAANADNKEAKTQIVNDIKTMLSAYEGKQGICPDGWHIPTATEIQNAFGSPIIGGSNTAIEDAPFYDKTYTRGKVSKSVELGFNFTLSGSVNISLTKGVGYQKNIIGLKEGDPEKVWQSPIAEWNGKNSVNGFFSSTFKGSLENAKDKLISNVQFSGVMTTFSKTYSEGAVFISGLNATSGYGVRCIKNN